MSPIKLLFIDDDRTMLRIAEEILSQLDLQVWTASSTTEADDVLKRETVDMVVCDIQMPGEDGVAYCRRLRASGFSRPVILLSAAIDEGIIAASGATLCLSKPFDVMDLHQRIVALAGKS